METIEVYADVRCPFTHVGLRRLVQRRAERGGGPRLVVHAWPLELVNGEPMDPHHIGVEVDAIRDQVAPDLFAGFTVEAFSSTSLPALALTAAAYEVSGEVGEQVALVVRDAQFEQGRDIADASVLAAIAAERGVGPVTEAHHEQVRADWATGVERGVIGSPHFIVDATGFFCPGLDIAHDDAGFHIAPDAEAFEAFVAQAFRP